MGQHAVADHRLDAGVFPAAQISYMAKTNGGLGEAEGAGTMDYLFARLDLVKAWTQKHGRGPMLPDVVENADEWGPGIYSAEQVLENAKANGWTPPKPEPKPKPKASVVWERDATGRQYPVAIKR